MRIWQYKIYLARHLGIPISELGQVPALAFRAMVKEVDYQVKLDNYNRDYQIAQLMCILTNSKTTKNRPETFIGEEPKRETRQKMPKKNTYEVVLGDGETYTLTILDANMMEAVEDEFDKTWDELFENPRVKVVKSLLLQMLLPNYPDMTVERVGKLVTAREFNTVVKVIMGMING
ncbi:MAG: hypothetical protein KAS32_27815 [Candidatus Peribacteraceae bacterium]|nr:hypothetical protein [Candidatus Peribacteraceae bacterium]